MKSSFHRSDHSGVLMIYCANAQGDNVDIHAGDGEF